MTMPSVPPMPPQMPMNTSKNTLGTWALVLGIVGIVCCGPAGIGAIIMGNQSKRAEADGLANNGSMGNVGWILGIVGVILWGVGLIVYLAILILAAAASTTN